jgi:hypothetical protein
MFLEPGKSGTAAPAPAAKDGTILIFSKPAKAKRCA